MTSQRKLYLFGDQTFDVIPHLKDLVSQRSNPLVEDFLGKAYDALRIEIYQLPAQVREDLPRFTAVEDLLLWSPGPQRCIPLDMAVTCLYQLATFISQADTDFPRAENSRVLGLCTGALAAAVVGSSRSSLDLIPLAVDAVIAAFKTGLHVTDVAKRVDVSGNAQSEQPWSVVVAGALAADKVAAFCKDTNLPLTSQPYISAVLPGAITVSGQPSTLAELQASAAFKDVRCKSIPIFGPYHAQHLFTTADVERIVASVASSSAAKASVTPVLSSAGVTTTSNTFKALLSDAVSQILLQPIRWSGILDELKTWISTLGELDESSAGAFQAHCFGTTADQLIYNALKSTSLGPAIFRTLTPARPASSTRDVGNPKKAKLAIISSSGRFPSAKDNEAFWDLLYQGLDVHKPVPPLHWDAKTHVDPTGKTKNTSATPFGCWLDEPAAFDARFFNISPREAAQIDPAQRIALMTAYEAIEKAGLVPDATPSTRRDRVGVFFGVTSNDWMETNSAQNIDTYFIPGGNRAFIPGRINYCFKFSGPSYAVDTACSSSLASIHLACNALWRGDIDTAIAGGTNVLTNPDFTSGLDRGHFLSRTGNCKTFDDGADGYCRGEGVATVIIKRLEDAIADKDPIQAVILGAYTNHSAESESITRPHVGAQQAIFSKILNQAGVDPYDVGYVEMHGTGTQAGDAGEMSSVLSTFAPPLDKVKHARKSDEPIYLGSAKSNIGHGEAVSGVSALVKVLLMMKKNMIVPHCGIKTKINHKFPTDLAQRNVHIALKPTPWNKAAEKPRRVFINNFSAAGGNSAILIEDAPPVVQKDVQDPRPTHLVAVSAKSGSSLKANLQSMIAFLKNSPVSLSQLSYTTTARRLHHAHRVIASGAQTQDIITQLETALKQETGMTRAKSAPKVLFAFTGNGAQYPGMGRELYETFSLFRNEINRLDAIGQSLGFTSVLPVIQSQEQDIGTFAPTPVQLATTCLQIALSRLWASWGIQPASVVGHSLGEYAALNLAGVLSDTDTIYLVGRRAQLLEAKCTRDTHSMLVVKGPLSTIVEALNGGKFEVACINSDIETVLAGTNEEVAKYQEILGRADMKTILLKVPYAFHSSQVDVILDDFTRIAKGVKFGKAKLPVLCPLDGYVLGVGSAFEPEYFARHCREPVNMLTALAAAHGSNVISNQTTTIEIGPHPAVSGMVKAQFRAITNLPSLQRGRSIWQTMITALKTLYSAGADITWAPYHGDFEGAQQVVELPAYSWDLKEYWMQYVNDWSLRKGDPPLVITSGANKLESTTIHNVLDENVNDKDGHMVVEADIARKDLSPLVQGHEVDGIPLCTPSVYCDIALSVGKYLVEKYRPQQAEKLVDVSDMTISKALILNSAGIRQPLQALIDVDWATNSAAIKFMSFDVKEKLQEHSRCVVRFKDDRLLTELKSEAESIKQKMQNLRAGIATETSARFNRPMVYRMIRPLARFHDDYRAIDEVVLNSKTLEASSKLSFGTVNQEGNYHTHPAVIDALTQSCGFTMNCNDAVDLDKEVFMNHGWGGFQIFKPLDFNKKYTTYTQMHEGDDKLWHGDVVVFDGDDIVASFKQIAIQGVPRRVLKVILSLESNSKNKAVAKPQAEAKTTAAPAPKSKAPAPTKAVNAAPAPAVDSIASKALTIIAEESGIAKADFSDNTIFADVGIDSLMGLTISARFREELELDIDFNSLFFEYPSVKDLKTLLENSGSESSNNSAVDSATESGGSSNSSEAGDHSSESVRTGATTPDLAASVDFHKVLSIISEESGVAVDDLTDDTCFADAGIDSLLSMVLVSRLRDELELELQHESLFLECSTVADLRNILCGTPSEQAPEPVAPKASEVRASEPVKQPDPKAVEPKAVATLAPGEASLEERKKAVDDYVAKYIAGYSGPTPNESAEAPKEKVVLVTGASGSLGSHIVYHLAQMDDIAKIICVNRQNRAEPNTRQYSAMREKGIRFPDALKHKLQIFQTDTAKPMFGLEKAEYDSLVGSVTHLIHNAWPMSAKRVLSGFESQFQVFRNLVDFATQIASSRPSSFKFSFQMVSSIGVVGRYELNSGKEKIIVPEQRVGIDTVLPNGYGEAKWGCERMLDESLHKFPQNFRTMAVRLGQIAGSKTSGYWNPMEHFGFLVKSSQTLNALPNLGGGLYWTPVNDIAAALSEIVLADNTPYPVYHIENPVGQSWRDMNKVLAECLNIPKERWVPFAEWLEMVRNAPQKDNPASTLLEFLDDNFLRMSCGGLVLDTKHSCQHSPTLAAVGPVPDNVLRKYIHIWKEIGFLKASAEDRAGFEEVRMRLWGPRVHK